MTPDRAGPAKGLEADERTMGDILGDPFGDPLGEMLGDRARRGDRIPAPSKEYPGELKCCGFGWSYSVAMFMSI